MDDLNPLPGWFDSQRDYDSYVEVLREVIRTQDDLIAQPVQVLIRAVGKWGGNANNTDFLHLLRIRLRVLRQAGVPDAANEAARYFHNRGYRVVIRGNQVFLEFHTPAAAPINNTYCAPVA